MWEACYEWLSSWSDLHERLEQVSELDDGRILTRSHQTATGRGSGFPLDYQLSGIFTVRDGRIARWEMHIDPASALAAAGLEGVNEDG
jgi:ketosteroid isomerase-like protein